MKNIFYFFAVSLLCSYTIPAQTGPDTIQVIAGWNLIGSLNTGFMQSILSTEPQGIILGSVYGYNPGSGYQAADTLKRGKGYWVKVSQNGIIIFGSTLNCGTVSYDGKIYNTVIIGTQCWLKENLDVGLTILGSQDQENNGAIEKYCFNDYPNNCTVYGGLYQWDEAMQYLTTPGTQGICPNGWHIPTLAEFQTLAATVNNDGNALKAIGQGTGGGAGTNTSGFSALLAGFRDNFGYFFGLGSHAYFWSSTEDDSMYAYFLDLVTNVSNIYMFANLKSFGFSVRCIKD